MATTSYMYHTLGLNGYDHLRSEYRGGRVYHHVRRQLFQRECRHCGARWDRLILEGRFQRAILALPVGRRRQYVVLHGHRQRCLSCGRTGREPIPFVRGNRRHTRSFARYVVELCAVCTLRDVASLLEWGGTSSSGSTRSTWPSAGRPASPPSPATWPWTSSPPIAATST